MTYSKTYLFASLVLLVSFGCAGEAARRATGPAAVSEPVRHSCAMCGPKCCRTCSTNNDRCCCLSSTHCPCPKDDPTHEGWTGPR